MTSNVVLKDKAAVILLNEIHQDPVLKAQLELYFKPYCDCDITEWIAGQVDLNNQPVINKILELIAFRDNFPITRGGPQPVLGQLLKQYCNGNDFVGIYADGNGGQVQKTIENVSEICTGPHSVSILFPLSGQDTLLQQESDLVAFSTELTSAESQVFDSNPRDYKLQLKLELNNSSDYQDLEFLFASVYDENGVEDYYDPGRVPLSTRPSEWTSLPTATFNPTTKVIKVNQSYINEHTRRSLENCNLLILKNQKLMGFVRLYYGVRPYDPDSPTGMSGNNYNSLSIYQGSTN